VGTNSLWIAFDQMGIRSFLGDLITLTEDDIMNLTVRPTRGVAHPEPIGLVWFGKSPAGVEPRAVVTGTIALPSTPSTTRHP